MSRKMDNQNHEIQNNHFIANHNKTQTSKYKRTQEEQIKIEVNKGNTY